MKPSVPELAENHTSHEHRVGVLWAN